MRRCAALAAAIVPWVLHAAPCAAGSMTPRGGFVQPPESTEKLTVEAVLAKVGEAYRAGPVYERVTLVVSAPGAGEAPRAGTLKGDEDAVRAAQGLGERRSTVWLKADHASGAADIDLGDVRICARAGRLVALRGSVPGLAFVVDEPGADGIALIERHLPPMPLPHLRLCMTDEDALAVPGLPPIAWQSAERITDAGRALIRLAGVCGSRPATARIDPGSHRILRVSVFPAGSAADRHAEPEFEVICTAQLPKPLEDLAGAAENRRRTSSLAELAPPVPQIAPGQTTPEWRVLDESGRALPISEAGGGPAADLSVVFIFAPARRPAREDLQVGEQVVRRLNEPGDRVVAARAAAVAAVSVDELQGSARAELQRQWASLVPAGAPAAVPLYVTPSAALTIERVAPDCSAALVVMQRVGGVTVLRGVVRLDGRSVERERISRELADLVNPR